MTRREAGSYIVDHARRVLRGQLPVTHDPEATGFFLACASDPARMAELTEYSARWRSISCHQCARIATQQRFLEQTEK